MDQEAATASGPWWRGRTKNQWRSFFAAFMGWALDVMDLMLFSMLITYVIAEFNSDRTVAGTIASFTLLASAAGGFIFGLIADRIGRTRSMVLSILCYSLGTVLCGLSTSMGMLLVFRIVVGLGVGGEWGAGAALVTETWPARVRGRVMAFVQSAFAVGYILAALIAAVFVPTLGWRWAFFFGVVPAALAWWIRRRTDEPQVWKDVKVRLTTGQALKALFANHARYFWVGFAFTGAAMLGYWGLFTWIPNYLGTPVEEGGRGMDLLGSTMWIVIIQLGAWLGFVSFGFVADWVGRRWAFIIYFLVATVCVPVFIALEAPAAVLVFGVVMGLFGTGFYSGFGPTFAEMFPTEIRAFAQSLIYNGARALSAVSPFVIGVASKTFGVGGALTITAGFYFLAAVIVFFFLPETRGTDLSEVGHREVSSADD
ncbi:MFS transporter [Enemella sp. A6]|uniref:MFS transporter n=1 Tax=Enemella sp. A6 TaxID=3440152 RepID=UPI003EB9291A